MSKSNNWRVWVRRNMPWSSGTAKIGFGVGAALFLLAGVAVLITPPTITASQYAALRPCPGDPVPNTGSCYSVLSGRLISADATGGSTATVVVEVQATQESVQLINLSNSNAFSSLGPTEVRYWKDVAVGVEVPHSAIFADTWNSPNAVSSFLDFARIIMIIGAVLAILNGYRFWQLR